MGQLNFISIFLELFRVRSVHDEKGWSDMLIGNLLIGLVALGVVLTIGIIWLSYKFLKPD